MKRTVGVVRLAPSLDPPPTPNGGRLLLLQGREWRGGGSDRCGAEGGRAVRRGDLVVEERWGGPAANDAAPRVFADVVRRAQFYNR